MGRLERAGHLGRDALAHLGHRDEDLVGAGGELRSSPASGRPSGRGRSGAPAARRAAAGARERRRPVPRAPRRARRAARRDRLAADRLAGPLRLDVVRHVLAGDPPAAAGADDLGGGQAVLAKEAADGRGHPGVGVAGRRRSRPRSAAGGARRDAAARSRALVGAGRAVGGAARRPAAGAGAAARRPPRARSQERARRGRGGARRPSALRRGRVGGGAAPSSAVSMTAISALFGTVAPSSTRISFRTPANGDGTSALTLSVMTSSERLVLLDRVARAASATCRSSPRRRSRRAGASSPWPRSQFLQGRFVPG